MSFIDFFRDLLNPKYDGYYDYYDYSEEQRRQGQNAKPVTEENKTTNKPIQVLAEVKENKEEQTQKTSEKPTEVKPIDSHKQYFYGDVYGPMPLEYDSVDRRCHRESFRKYYRKEKKDVIVFAIENSIYTRCYAKNIEAIIKRIVDSNKSSFFMMLKVGDGKQFFETTDYEAFTKSDAISGLFDESQKSTVDYAEVLEHIVKFRKDTSLEYEYKNTRYDIQNISVIFIGSGKTCSDSETIDKVSKLVADIKSNRKTKTIKYFCMSDRQAIDVAKLGFPVIGHIENDFYK